LIIEFAFYFYLGKDAYDVAVEKEFDECKELISKALEKRGIKPGVKQQPPAPPTDKVTEDVEKLKIKR
jgi:hypothetical protein